MFKNRNNFHILLMQLCGHANAFDTEPQKKTSPADNKQRNKQFVGGS